MRQSLVDFFKDTVVFQYTLPNNSLDIDKSIYTTSSNDYCYKILNEDSNLVELIVNSIVEYSFNETELLNKDILKKHFSAIRTRLRYEENDNQQTKEKYGFYGEVILNLILQLYFGTEAIVAKGFFYDPLKPEENKGFDSFHLIEKDKNIDLWFGEVKFHQSYSSALSSIFVKIEDAISDKYFHKNLLAMESKRYSLNTNNSGIAKLLEEISDEPNVVIADLVEKYKLKLVYPILIMCDTPKNYDYTIKSIIEKIKNDFCGKKLSIGFDYELFFILLPVGNTKQIKLQVIEWIDSKKPLTLL